MNALLVLLPDFAVIALGAFLSARVGEEGWRRIDWLSYHVLYPALLFRAAASRPIEPGALLLVGTLACAVVTLGFVLSLAVTRRAPVDRLERAGAVQNGWRFNTALGFVAIAALPDGASAVLAIVVGTGIPLANLYAVTLLSRAREAGSSRRDRLLAALREIALNPFLLASLAGVAIGLGGIALPAVPAAFVARLADAALPIVLLSLGAALRGTPAWPPAPFALALHAIRLLILPAVVWIAATLSGASGLLPATLLVFAALPTATAAHVLAARYGADRRRVALLVMQSSLLGLVTLPLWTALAARLSGG